MYPKGNALDLKRKMMRKRNNVYCNRKSTVNGKKKGSCRNGSYKKLKRWKEEGKQNKR